MLGAETVPRAVSYTDHDTVLMVQMALKGKSYDPGPLDGIFGPKTSAAIKKMQGDAGIGKTGIVDYGVLMALGVKAPAYTPTLTTASASAAAQDAAAVAASATTPAAVQAASQQVEAANAVALPPPPPAVQTKVAQAAAAARAATTPAEAQAAALQVQDAAKAVASSTSFLGAPLWAGAPLNRWQGALAVAGAAAVGIGLASLFGGKRRRR